VPTVQHIDEIRAALKDIMRAIVKPPATSPQLEFTPTKLAGLQNLHATLHGSTKTNTELEPASMRVAHPAETSTATAPETEHAAPLRVAVQAETVAIPVEQSTNPAATPASSALPAALTPATLPTTNTGPDITYTEATGGSQPKSTHTHANCQSPSPSSSTQPSVQ
jgi:hypothetical protein